MALYRFVAFDEFNTSGTLPKNIWRFATIHLRRSALFRTDGKRNREAANEDAIQN
jgi:hypothetical protein